MPQHRQNLVSFIIFFQLLAHESQSTWKKTIFRRRSRGGLWEWFPSVYSSVRPIFSSDFHETFRILLSLSDVSRTIMGVMMRPLLSELCPFICKFSDLWWPHFNLQFSADIYQTFRIKLSLYHVDRIFHCGHDWTLSIRVT